MVSTSSSGDWTNPNFYIEVERDYTRDPNRIRFATNFPLELEGSVTRQTYVGTIEGINAFFEEAESFSWATTLESLLWCVTCTGIQYCKKTRIEIALAKVQSFICEQNDTVFHPVGLHVVHPIVCDLLGIGIRNISKYQLYKGVTEIRSTFL